MFFWRLWSIFFFGSLCEDVLYLFDPDKRKTIRRLNRLFQNILKRKFSLVFKKTSSNNDLLHKYTIYIYIYTCVCVCVCVSSFIVLLKRDEINDTTVFIGLHRTPKSHFNVALKESSGQPLPTLKCPIKSAGFGNLVNFCFHSQYQIKIFFTYLIYWTRYWTLSIFLSCEWWSLSII